MRRKLIRSTYRAPRRGAAALAATLAFASAATAADEVAAQFLAEVERLRVEKQIPGLSVAVVQDGEIRLAAGLGQASTATGVRAGVDTTYNIASVSKTISGVLVMRLVERGEIDLDRPVAEYSEWNRFCRSFSQQESIFAKDLDCDAGGHTLRHMLGHTAAGTPGTRFSYNPVVFSWGSRPVMSALGEDFSSLVQRFVLSPAGMHSAARKHRRLVLPPEVSARMAPPHRLDDAGRIVPAEPPGPQGDGAAGGVVASVLDLARFDIALDSGVLISAASRDAMLAPGRGVNGERYPYGVGWWVETHDDRKLVWHGGWWPEAYSALYLKVPAEGISLILLANSEGLWWGNPLDEANVSASPFAQRFLASFVTPTEEQE